MLPLVFLAAAGLVFAHHSSGSAAAQAANLDQCRNGGVATPQTFTQCTAAAWVNGNAGASNSHYREGESISYRAAVTGLNSGDNVVLILGYDVIHSHKYAIDYLTDLNRWQTPETTVGATPDVPCSGVSTCVGPVLAAIPTPPGSIHVDPTKTLASGQCLGTTSSGLGPLQPSTSFGAVPAAERSMEFFNVSGTPTISYFGTIPDFTSPAGGDQEQQIKLTFTAGSSQVEIAWGGHIATRLDWGCADGPLSAGGISGSPYHMRLKDMTVNNAHVNLGNQDRSLSAAAIVFPPSITLTKTPSTTDVCNGSNTQVTYTYVVNNTGAVAVTGSVVDDNATPLNTGDDVTIGTFTNLAAGASQSFTHVFTVSGTRTNTAKASATTSDGLSTTATASATVAGHTCTISLTKTPSTTNVCAGSNTSVTYTYVVKNTGDFFNVSGSLTDNVLGNIGSFGPLAPGASATLTKVGTVNGTQINTGTATGTFNDSASSTASATATATVTGHTCTISLSKTAGTSDVCSGSNTSVTFTYVVKNTGDFFGVSGSISDDKLGTIGSFGPLAPGASQTLTKVGTVNGTVTNTGTATGTFTDTAGTSASATATATVTGHTCTISLTKSANHTDVCTGTNTSVTYTYVVKNTGDFFNASGTVTDNVNGAIGSFGPLAPGASQTLTKVATVTGTVTNIGTASATFDDSASTTASATATATVTGHTCTISLTKTPSVTSVCNGSNTPVTYTYVVKNTGDFFNASGTVTDNVYGSIGSFGPLAPGASQTLTKTAAVNGTITNIGTASATFDDSANTSATATATATVTGVKCAQITPTNTTCSQFAGGTSATLSELDYTIKNGTINSVAPGVFFYWIAVPASAGSNTFTIHQAITTANFDSHFFAVAAGSNAFDANCVAIGSTSITQSGADVTVTFTSASAGTVYLGIKFESTSVKGFAVPSPTTVHYDFTTLDSLNNPLLGSLQGLDLKQKLI